MTISEAEDAGLDAMAARMVTVVPAGKVEAGVNRPEAVMKPVEPAPPVAPLTAQANPVLATPLAEALYCTLPPNLTLDGPVSETAVAACARRPPVQTASKKTTEVSARE